MESPFARIKNYVHRYAKITTWGLVSIHIVVFGAFLGGVLYARIELAPTAKLRPVAFLENVVVLNSPIGSQPSPPVAQREPFFWSEWRLFNLPRMTRFEPQSPNFRFLGVIWNECTRYISYVRYPASKMWLTSVRNYLNKQMPNNVHGWRLTSIRDCDRSYVEPFITYRELALGDHDINPRTLVFPQNIQLTVQNKELIDCCTGKGETKERDPDCSRSSFPSSFIGGCFLLALGAALVSLAFYIADEPSPPFATRSLSWIVYLMAGVCIFAAFHFWSLLTI